MFKIFFYRRKNVDISIALGFLEGSVDRDKTNAFLQKELGDLYRISHLFIKARDAYLKATSKPDFYIVDSMDNHVALAEATGVSPQRLFEMVCLELKGSKKKYEKQ
mgnify:CR=1 FL=1